MIDQSLANGIRVSAWTFDELYGRDGKFLDALEQRQQVFVAEIPVDFISICQQGTAGCENRKFCRKSRKTRGVDVRRDIRVWPPATIPAKERNLVKYSPGFRKQSWQPYRIKDTDKGSQVWEVKWAVFWRKDEDGLPTRRHCLIVARNVLTGEVKYFLANRVPGEPNPVTGACVTLRWLLRVAFGRCSIESCFREGKEELGMDHYEVRGWRCLHRHFYVTQLTHLFCARMRLACDTASENELDRVTVEQVRSVVNIWLDTADLPPAARRTRIEDELRKQQWYQRRNKQARKSHTKTRIGQLAALGIDVDKIKSCLPRPPT